MFHLKEKRTHYLKIHTLKKKSINIQDSGRSLYLVLLILDINFR